MNRLVAIPTTTINVSAILLLESSSMVPESERGEYNTWLLFALSIYGSYVVGHIIQPQLPGLPSPLANVRGRQSSARISHHDDPINNDSDSVAHLNSMFLGLLKDDAVLWLDQHEFSIGCSIRLVLCMLSTLNF